MFFERKLTKLHQIQKQPPEVFYIKRPATLLRKRLWHGCFPMNFADFKKTFHRKPPIAASENIESGTANVSIFDSSKSSLQDIFRIC